VDDHGTTVKVDPEKEQFEYLDEVYVVARKRFEDIDAGEVLVADDASEDKSKLSVKGLGFRAADDLVVLDGTNVFPGVVVCDQSTGSWKKLLRVDEALWVMPEGGSMMRSPEEFRFAVSQTDGELMMEPLVTCVDVDGLAELTPGKRYYLVASLLDKGMVEVRNDRGVLEEYAVDRFRMG
jgi:hypothetical protein